MSAILQQQYYSSEPPDYVTPSFPSLYWPFPVGGPEAYWLYHASDIWAFTTVWHVIFFGTVHLVTSGYACAIQYKNWKTVWVSLVVYLIIGGIEAVITGSVLGGLLGAVYNSGYFRMSTWMPFVWAFISTLILILSSFAMQGSL